MRSVTRSLRPPFKVDLPWIEEMLASIGQHTWIHGQSLLDVGSGDGSMSRLAAWHFRANELYMVDSARSPRKYQSPILEWNHRMDVSDAKFVDRFRGKVTVITCINTIHELEDPYAGVSNIFRLALANKAALIILDISPWAIACTARTTKQIVPVEMKQHFQLDLERMQRTGLATREEQEAFYQRVASEMGCHDMEYRDDGRSVVVLVNRHA